MTLTDTILMIRPASFGFNYETATDNFFQVQTGLLSQEQIQQLAIAEFDNMVRLLRANEIEVLVIDDTPLPKKPSAIFPNNWLSTTPWGSLILYPMCFQSRRAEKRTDIINQIQSAFAVASIQDWSRFEGSAQFLEGTGSMIFDYDNKIIYACVSARTDLQLLKLFAAENGFQVFSFIARDKFKNPIYHTNVMMCLGVGVAIICIDSIAEEGDRIEIIQLLQMSGRELVFLSLEQLHRFSGNMLQIKNKHGVPFLVMSQSAFDCLNALQKNTLSKHTNLLPISVKTIEDCEGGSVRCMMAEIFLSKK